MRNGKRDYKRELDWEHKKKPNRVKDRAARNKARATVEKKTGNLPSSKHVDHIKPLTEGGSKGASNLRVVSARTNLRKEGLRKRKNGY